MKRVSEIFNVAYGHNLELNRLQEVPDGINFVSRTANNNGVSARVAKLDDIEPAPAGTITVALSGSVMEAFVQPEPFYTAYHIFLLTPHEPMTFREKLFYCMCLRANRYRYNYGRQANRTLRDIQIPSRDEIPEWVYLDEPIKKTLQRTIQHSFKPFEVEQNKLSAVTMSEPLVKIGDLFDVVYGTNLELNAETQSPDGINFVSRTSKNNGVSAKIKRKANLEPIQPVVLTVAAGGSVMETFLQVEPFYSGRDLYYLRPKIPLSIEELLYYCICIRSNRYRYNYGRQANRTLRDIKIPAPNYIPDWVRNGKFLEQYRRELDSIAAEVFKE